MKKYVILSLCLLLLVACKNEKVYEATSIYGCEVKNSVLDCDTTIHTDYPDGTMLFLYEYANGKIICKEEAGIPPVCTDTNQNPINGTLRLGLSNGGMVKTQLKNGNATLEQHFYEDGRLWLEIDYVSGKTNKLIDGRIQNIDD